MNALRLGSKRDARKALLGQLERLGSGKFRDVYCDRERRVVYKVDQYRDRGFHTGNADELRSHDKLAGKPMIPQTTSWVIEGTVVVCQPMMCKTGRDIRRDSPEDFHELVMEVEDLASELGIDDLHMENWMVDAQGNPWVTDIQMTYDVDEDRYDYDMRNTFEMPEPTPLVTWTWVDGRWTDPQ